MSVSKSLPMNLVARVIVAFLALLIGSASGEISLYAGNCLAPAQLDSLGETTLPRSGFLEIFGSGLGSSGEVLIGGHEAITTSWTDTRIVAYVPEAAGPGMVPVQVINEGGASNTLDMEVTLRQQVDRKLWRLRMDTLYSQVRPAIGPDGTVYAVDVYDRLYAVSPDGALLWLVEQAGSKGVDVDNNGIIYTGNEDWIKAFNPDGTLRWTYHQNPRAFILPDVAVGPDGNIYALASSGMGIFSLTPNGVLRWATPEPYRQPIVSYTEIIFGPGPDGRNQLYFHANRHTRAIRLEDGEEIFAIGSAGEHAVSTVDGTLHSSTIAYFPDGNVAWQFNEFLNGTPTIGESGVHYSTTSLVTPRVYALNIDGSERWNAVLAENAYKVDVDPTETQLLLGTYDVLSVPSAFFGVDTGDGTTLWRFELPAEDPHIANPGTGDMGFNQFVDSRAAFTNNGATAYVTTAIAAGSATTDRAFLYALDMTGQSMAVPDSYALTIGSHVSGGVAEVAESDDEYLVMNPQFMMSRYQNVFTVDAIASTNSPTALNFTLEAKVANIVGTVDQKIELFNYVTGQYETVDNRLATSTDSVVVVQLGGDPTRFVQTGTGAMRARVSYQNSLPYWVSRTVNLFLPFRTSIDQIFWTVTP